MHSSTGHREQEEISSTSVTEVRLVPTKVCRVQSLSDGGLQQQTTPSVIQDQETGATVPTGEQQWDSKTLEEEPGRASSGLHTHQISAQHLWGEVD